ncbi:MAG: LPS export ABC transporter periplasmic protein LptC [Candidatus Omnitrophota bacterium]
MSFKISVISIFLCFFTVPVLGIQDSVFSQESGQQIQDFSLAGYGEKGKKSWDLSGKTADIFTEIVKLNDVVGNLYGKEEDVRLTAERGDFNKEDGCVHLEQNVIITTSSGVKLMTDALDWDRKNQLISTANPVDIQRDNLRALASGARAEPNLKRIALEKDVRLDIDPVHQEKIEGSCDEEKVVITCDGPLEIDYEKNVAVFNNNVKVEKQEILIYSDRMDVFFSSGLADNEKKEKTSMMAGNKIEKIVSTGHVKIVRGLNVSYSEEAIYTALDKKITLNGRPRLVIYSAEDFKNASPGN